MNRFTFFAFSLMLTLGTTKAQENEKNTPTVKLSGWVNAETFYDTRQTCASREGEILLYPDAVKKDDNGDDINGASRWNMLSFMSRARIDASEIEAFGAQTTAKIEVDFLGTGSDFVNMIRMRHAFVNMKWDKTQLLFGQYWHPMFVPECFPTVLIQGAAITLNPLNRSPQIRLTYNLTKEMSVMGALLTQQYHKGYGHSGNNSTEKAILSADPARNSGLPEIQFQFKYKSESLVAGLTGGYHWVTPRLVTDSSFAETEKLGAYNIAAFAKYSTGKLTAKLEGNYGQNMARFVMLGGYAVASVDATDDSRTYTNLTSGSMWAELSYAPGKYEIGILAGATKNFGANEDIVARKPVYARGSNIDMVYNIIPRIAFKSGKMKFGVEAIYMNAAYGTPNNKLQVEDTEDANNLRLLFSVYRYF